MVQITRCLTNLLFFDIPLLYCYTNFNSLITLCLFSEDMYLPFNASLNSSKISRNIHVFLGTSLNSLITCCLFSGNMYLSFITSVSLLVLLFYIAFFAETLVILLAILLRIQSPVASTVF